MKKSITFFSIVLLLTLTLVGRPFPASAETVTLYALDWAPYQFANSKSDLRGSAIEFIEVALKRVGLSVEFKFLPWKRQLHMTKLGMGAGITLCSWREDREEFIVFSNAVSHGTDGFWTRRDFEGPELKTLEETVGQKVGGVLGYGTFKALQEVVPGAKGYRTENFALRNLLKGAVDYLFLPGEGPAYQAKNMGVSAELKFSKMTQKDYFLCLSKKWPEVKKLVVKFNKGLAEIKADGTYDTILDRYR